MRLICPNCGAQYEVPDDAIPEAGRDVQCSACGHTWFEGPVADAVPEDSPDAGESYTDTETDADLAGEGAADIADTETTAREPGDTESPGLPVPEGQEAGDLAGQGALVPADLPVPGADSAEPDPAAASARTAGRGARPVRPAARFERTETMSGDPDDADRPVAAHEDAPDEDALLPDPDAPDPSADAAEADAPHVDPGQPAAARRKLDPAVADVLREERDASQALKSGKSAAAGAAAGAVAGAAVAATGTAPAAPRTSKTEEPRSTRLPDVDEINSTLRPDGEGHTRSFEQHRAEKASRSRRRGFRLGFFLICAVALLAWVIYWQAPRLSQAVPAAAPTLDSYVETVDAARIWLDTRLQRLMGGPVAEPVPAESDAEG